MERELVAVAELMRERRVVAETERVPLTLTLTVVVDDVDRVSIDVRDRRAVAVDDLDSWAVLVKVDELDPVFV